MKQTEYNEYSDQIVYKIILKEVIFNQVINTLMFNINSSQKNYHKVVVDNNIESYITSNYETNFHLKDKSLSKHIVWIFLMLLPIYLLLNKKVNKITLPNQKKKIINYLNIFYFMIILFLYSCNKNGDNNSNTKSKPNILLIIADDMGIDATPGYKIGSTKPNMPNLVNLQKNGITFDNAWAYPQCAPTRASILTGKYGFRTGVLNAVDHSTIPRNEKTIQAYLDEKLGKVYAHSIIGKWHLSNNEPNRPKEMGIDYYTGLLGGAASNYNNWKFTENGQTNENKEYITTKFTDLAIDWIKRQNSPWFCWLAYTSPHTPFHLPPYKMHSQGRLPSDQASISANPLPYYMAMMESLDYEIGRIMKSIPSDELSNTIIIFIGDNGTQGNVIQTPYQSNRSKGTVHQGGIHVPLIVSGVNVTRKGERDQNLISSTDLFATIAQIAGIPTSVYQDSYSFFNLLSHKITAGRKYNYSEVLNQDTPVKSGYTIRNKKYKLMVLDNNSLRFYDLENDPFESKNLLNNTLSSEEKTAYDELTAKASEIRK